MVLRKFNFRIMVFYAAFFFTIPLLFAQNYSLAVEEGKIIYNEDHLGNRVLDFSYCGYKNSNEDIPYIDNTVFVAHQVGDASQIIQRAIKYVESLPLNDDGFRGAVLLDRGVFTLNEPLTITQSGVVLRGTGRNETVLRKAGTDRNAFIRIEGKNDIQYIDTFAISSEYIPVNSRVVVLQTVSGLNKGDGIMVFRPSSTEWISKLGCDHFGGGITALGWKAGDIDIMWDRNIREVNDGAIEIDAPLSMTLDSKEAASEIYTYQWPGRITNSGIENIQLESEYDKNYPKDEDHCWTAISIENARDCWVRKIVFKHFAGSAVILQPSGSRITVEDCISLQPVSEIGGMRRNTFLTMGQLNLFQRCYSEEGIHDFAAGYCAPGPNAFVQCATKDSKGYSGAIDSWACGLLFDIVDIDGNNLVFKHLGQHKNGAGWGTANSLFWQSTAAEIECYSPDPENKNRAYGCWGQFSGDGEWYGSNNHLRPRSIFYAQLSERLNVNIDERARILPINTSATSSPTVEQAMEMAQEAYNPRLTLQKWIEDNLCMDTAGSSTLLSVSELDESDNSENKQFIRSIEIVDGKISMDKRLLTGGKQDVPWWSGKLRTGNIQNSKPHITRFVPGREGWGLTDRIDSVIAFMAGNNLVVLDHNYGLWYDRRRDDHQRVRRKDGDVWGPFYEQPFARSGTGTAWDGLSRYDLSKPNEWYWSRLKEFADKASDKGILLFHENYFQHNILEAGAHWVDSPWRTANNINSTGFPEPVPFAGDKRIFIADMFYDTDNPVRKELHREYIRQCLNSFADNTNVIQLISAEFTGPLHFVQFWIDEIAAWEQETEKNAIVALSTTKDVQDAILNDPVRSEVVDIIDIRYWHYKDNGDLYAPEGGKNMAPRQFARQMKVGKITFEDVYKAVKEYREKYPQKAVTYYSQKYPEMAWAIFMAGGSLSQLPVIQDASFFKDALLMDAKVTPDYYKLEKSGIGAIIYSRNNLENTPVQLSSGVYQLKNVDTKTGNVAIIDSEIVVKETYTFNPSHDKEQVYWFKRIGN